MESEATRVQQAHDVLDGLMGGCSSEPAGAQERRAAPTVQYGCIRFSEHDQLGPLLTVMRPETGIGQRSAERSVSQPTVDDAFEFRDQGYPAPLERDRTPR